MQKQGLADSVGPIFEVCENDCIRYIAILTDKEGFFVPGCHGNRSKENTMTQSYQFRKANVLPLPKLIVIFNPLNDPIINVLA